jgi:hypothetical protein
MKLLIVVGSPRSGTTMTAGLLRSAGAWFGSAAVAPNMDNITLQERVLRPFVQMCGVDPDSASALPVNPVCVPVIDTAVAIEREFKWQGWTHERVVGIKDKHAVGLIPSLLQAFPNLLVVTVRRDVAETAASCVRTDWMKPHRSENEWREWAGVWERALSTVRDLSGERARDFWPSRCVRGDFAAARDLCRWCGLGWDEQAAFKYVNPKQWGDGRAT